MYFSLDNAYCYDIETFPNCFTFSMEMLNSDLKASWEISPYRNDKKELLTFLAWSAQQQAPMIGFNNINFDYPVVHLLWSCPHVKEEELYSKAMEIINCKDRFSHLIWASDRFAPQIDLFKLHHFDNKAKSTGLKALEINMRSDRVVDMPVKNGSILTEKEISEYLIPYNAHDVSETKRFAEYSRDAIAYRVGLIEQFGLDVLNWNDTKIGEQTVVQRLGDEKCYDRSSGKRKMRQTHRSFLNLKDLMFPYIRFENPEFHRVFAYLCSQTLKSDEIDRFGDELPKIKTKDVFTDLTARVGGIDFFYGVGGIHGSVEKKRIESSDEWMIQDIDVAALYPSIAIVNKLAPEHLGADFVQVYSELPKERKKWQKEKGKKCTEANTLKLASNGVYGKSNSVYSPFYDPKFTLTITLNGQMLLSMLIEKLVKVPTLKIIQANTDGITYLIKKEHQSDAEQVCRNWETLTGLVLESTSYKRMWIRDVNNYIAENQDGSLKLKGNYWTPDGSNYHKSISEAQPVSWHKNFSNVISVKAAVAFMVHGVNIEHFIKCCTNPFDFLVSVKIKRSDKLFWGEQEIQRNSRFYVSQGGQPLKKEMPPNGTIGAYKKANSVSDKEYAASMKKNGGAWDASVCTKNKSKYEKRETGIVAGHTVKVCNDIAGFTFDDLDYGWYVHEAEKLCV